MAAIPHHRPPAGRSIARLAAIGAAAALVLAAAAPVATATTSSSWTHSTLKLHRIGTSRITHTAPRARSQTGTTEFRPAGQEDTDAEVSGSRSSQHVPSAGVPRPATLPVVDASAGFGGLNHYDQRFAGTGAYTNTQFSLEPPDQGLCTDGTNVVETVNTAVRVRTTTGGLTTQAEALNQFFHLAPEIDRSTLTFGDFTSDPKCYWDPDTGHFFLTIVQLDVVPATGDFAGRSHEYVAVTATTDPAGTWNIFSFDVTNNGTGGTPSHPGCPCFGDQPLLGADANGIYISTNEYSIFGEAFNGANVYALSKAALAAGSMPAVHAFWKQSLAEGPAYSIQPSTTPPGASYASVQNGTEYFLSALEFTGRVDNRIALWAMTNTNNLKTDTSPTMGDAVVMTSIPYGAPPTIPQKPGPRPLMDLLNDTALAESLGLIAQPVHEHPAPINSNDDRMNQTVWDGTHIWGAVNTVVKSPTGATRVGIAYFGVKPSWSGSTLGGAVEKQGYVAVNNNSVVFPAIAANKNGQVAMVFTLSGPNYYPSAAYVTFSATTSPTAVKVAKWGDGPPDGFTGYRSQDAVDNGVERWGDYSAAVADPAGNIWIATETINQSCTLPEFVNSNFTCGNTRTLYANWGTWIAKVTP